MLFLHPCVWCIISFGQCYLELKSSSPDLGHVVYVNPAAKMPPFQPLNISDVQEHQLPVKLPRSQQYAAALIDPEDKPRLVQISSVWRMSSSGYIITSTRRNGKYIVRYLHKEILGQTGTHLNGNKFDNRKSNLQEVTRRVRRVQDSSQELILKTATPLMNFSINHQDVPMGVLEHVTIDYPEGKTYIGSVRDRKPYGVGKLIEMHPVNKESYGTWKHGELMDGIVTVFKPVAPRVRQEMGQLSIHSSQILYVFMVMNGISLQF